MNEIFPILYFQDKNASSRTSPNLKKISAIPDHQIDGTKKKLIADQIRQKMRTIMTPLQTPIYKPEKYRPRGKGRPVKSPQAFSTAGMVCRHISNVFEFSLIFFQQWKMPLFFNILVVTIQISF